MCNPGQGVYDRGIQIGREEGMQMERKPNKQLKKAMLSQGRLQEFLDAIDNSEKLSHLYAEYGLIE